MVDVDKILEMLEQEDKPFSPVKRGQVAKESLIAATGGDDDAINALLEEDIKLDEKYYSELNSPKKPKPASEGLKTKPVRSAKESEENNKQFYCVMGSCKDGRRLFYTGAKEHGWTVDPGKAKVFDNLMDARDTWVECSKNKEYRKVFHRITVPQYGSVLDDYRTKKSGFATESRFGSENKWSIIAYGQWGQEWVGEADTEEEAKEKVAKLEAEEKNPYTNYTYEKGPVNEIFVFESALECKGQRPVGPKQKRPNSLDADEACATENSEETSADEWGIWQTGGSIGESRGLISRGLTRERAQEIAKKWNKNRTLGEKNYYKIHYRAVQVTPARLKQMGVTESVVEPTEQDSVFPEEINFDEEAFANLIGVNPEDVTIQYIPSEENEPEYIEVKFKKDEDECVLKIKDNGSLEQVCNAEIVDPAEFTSEIVQDDEGKFQLMINSSDDTQVDQLDDSQEKTSVESCKTSTRYSKKAFEELVSAMEAGDETDRKVYATLPKDVLMNPSEVNFKNILSQRQKARDEEIAKQKEAEKKAALVKKYQNIIDKIKAAPKVTNGEGKDRLCVAFDKLVPGSGKCETVAGEIVRAMMRIMYRYYNDGDMFYEGYGLETVAPSMQYLIEEIGVVNEDELMHLTETISFDEKSQENKYEAYIIKLANNVIEYLIQNPDLFAEPNNIDSRDWDTNLLEDLQPKYDYEIESSETIYDAIELGLCDAWRLNEYVEDVLSDNYVFENAEVERPWNKKSSTVSVSNLTRDGYEELKDMCKDLDDFWDSLVDEIIEENGTPDTWGEDEEEDDSPADESFNEKDANFKKGNKRKFSKVAQSENDTNPEDEQGKGQSDEFVEEAGLDLDSEYSHDHNMKRAKNSTTKIKEKTALPVKEEKSRKGKIDSSNYTKNKHLK